MVVINIGDGLVGGGGVSCPKIILTETKFDGGYKHRRWPGRGKGPRNNQIYDQRFLFTMKAIHIKLPCT